MRNARLAPPPRRWMHGEALRSFKERPAAEIIGELTQESAGAVEPTQVRAWQAEIEILKAIELGSAHASQSHLYLEYTVPRLGRRADAILIVGHVLFVLEFKVGESLFTAVALDQVWDYALDLKHFHDASHALCIVPVMVATKAQPQTASIQITSHNDGLARPVRCHRDGIREVVSAGLAFFDAPPIDVVRWERGRYLPTPTIIEAARALYAGHAVETISRSGAGADNLAVTSKAVDQIIEAAKRGRRKVICFVTGVPGAGKTLVGLDVANRHLDQDSATYSVFLSGNGPLVAVLREALARDRVERAGERGERLRKGEARKEVEAFIQNVHHFRDEYLKDGGPPPEHVVLFDEAQRAWTLAQTEAFMKQKKGRPNFGQSEPAFLISCLDRHEDWAVVVCLVGGGQEINTGEAGIREWFDAVVNDFPEWDVHVSPQLTESEYRSGTSLKAMLTRPGANSNANLHLATSMRSVRAASLSRFVREVLDVEVDSARATFREFSARYPMRITRRLDLAKRWLREQARGSERYGIVVSSQAERLKPHAIDVRVKTDPVKWFLDGKDDTRSSYYLEDVATEFQVQGLELDWACLVWDADLRRTSQGWSHHEFRGSRWIRIHRPERQRYLENAYRVLMTRARQGMVVVVPEGDAGDPTRESGFYDGVWEYLRRVGVGEL